MMIFNVNISQKQMMNRTVNEINDISNMLHSYTHCLGFHVRVARF